MTATVSDAADPTVEARRLIDRMLAAHTSFAEAWRDGAPLTSRQQRAAAVRDTARTKLLRLVKQPEPATVSEAKPTNPKDALGADKLPLHLWPAVATALGSLALLDGALKYGRSNFRAVGVRASIYKDAVFRHMDAWFEGEDADPASGLSHLAHALAGLAILVDAQAAGKLTDDRMFPGGYRAAVDALTPHVSRLKALHAGREDVRHYDVRCVAPVPAPVPEASPRPATGGVSADLSGASAAGPSLKWPDGVLMNAPTPGAPWRPNTEPMTCEGCRVPAVCKHRDRCSTEGVPLVHRRVPVPA